MAFFLANAGRQLTFSSPLFLFQPRRTIRWPLLAERRFWVLPPPFFLLHFELRRLPSPPLPPPHFTDAADERRHPFSTRSILFIHLHSPSLRHPEAEQSSLFLFSPLFCCKLRLWILRPEEPCQRHRKSSPPLFFPFFNFTWFGVVKLRISPFPFFFPFSLP